MAGAAGATQALRQVRDADQGLIGHAVRVHFLDAWGEQQVATGLQKLFLIGRQRTRVSGQVFVGAEL